MNRRKDMKRYELYFTLKDWSKIQKLVKKYGYKNSANYIRKRALDEAVVIEDIQNKLEIIKEMNAIGRNLNQAVRSLNELARKNNLSKDNVIDIKLLAKDIVRYQETIFRLLNERLFVVYKKEGSDPNDDY